MKRLVALLLISSSTALGQGVVGLPFQRVSGAAPPGCTPPTVVQVRGESERDSATYAISAASDVTSGNYVFAVVNNYTAAVTDTLGADHVSTTGTATLGSWTLLAQQHRGTTSNSDVGVFVANVTGSGSLRVTIGPDPGLCYGQTAIIEVNGLTGVADGSGVAIGSGTDVSTSSFNTTSCGIIVGVTGNNASGAPSLTLEGDYTLIIEYEDGATSHAGSIGYRLTSGALTGEVMTWTLGGSETWICAAAGYK